MAGRSMLKIQNNILQMIEAAVLAFSALHFLPIWAQLVISLELSTSLCCSELLSQIIQTVHDYNLDTIKFSGSRGSITVEKARKVDVQGHSSKAANQLIRKIITSRKQCSWFLCNDYSLLALYGVAKGGAAWVCELCSFCVSLGTNTLNCSTFQKPRSITSLHMYKIWRGNLFFLTQLSLLCILQTSVVDQLSHLSLTEISSFGLHQNNDTTHVR